MSAIDDLKAKKAAEDAAAQAAEASRPPTVQEALDALQRHEDLTVPGARSRMPKEMMMDAPEAREKHPDLHLRMVHPQNMEARKLDGYRRLTSEEGGKELAGHGVLMGIPKAEAERRKKAIEKENADRLVAHKREAEGIAEGLARELRDRHGLNISAERILRD